MKKMIVLLAICLMAGSLFAGGIVTNTNQSAMYVRTLNRNASTDLDAAFYNPAGLMSMDNGFYIHFSNQSVKQTRDIKSYNPYLNNGDFEGLTNVLLYPDLYLAYKQDKFALSFNMIPIGGGGSAEFEDGLPSYESGVAGLVPMLTAKGVSDIRGYRNDIDFVGSSIYLGFQGNVSYKLNNMVSVSVGGRYVIANNKYEGHLKNIELNYGGQWMAPGKYFHDAATKMNAVGGSLNPLIQSGAGGNTLEQLLAAQKLSADQVAEIEGGLVAMGLNPEGYTVDQIQATYYRAATQAAATGVGLDVQTADIEVDAKQSANGFCSIFGVNITPFDGLNIGLKYETKTKLEFENDTKRDDSGKFKDKDKFNEDMPALFAAGVSYKLNNKIRLESSLNYYFDEDVDWGGKEDSLENGYEIGLACEYSISEKFRVSMGYLYAQASAKDAYNTDLHFNISSNSIALGCGYDLNDQYTLDFGVLNTAYIDGNNDYKKSDKMKYEKY